ncbi:hypothetical protein Mapa_009017 [Marchantia paleacea]|nr:hypothetical protein Mapa_009017 [Marchantia paleacea]
MKMVAIVPTPGFEGFEKRLEIEFFPAPDSGDQASGDLRKLSRPQLNELLKHAECTIVSELKSEGCDSYVLSESSLFVYPLKMVLKTCGTTQLLKAVPSLLEFTAELKLKAIKCKYTRGTFMFPGVQPFPHNSFEEEVKYLEQYFGYLGGKAYVLGDLNMLPNWHLYVASEESSVARNTEPTFTLEMCMTELDQTQAHKFYNADGSLSGLQMTKASCIDKLLPKAEICDFAFNPCGYSMNALEGGAHSTIHVTPEDNMSYASYESMGYGPKEMNLQELVDGVASVFKPAKLAMSVFLNNRDFAESGSWGAAVAPAGYTCVGSTRQELSYQGVVVFHTFELVPENSTRQLPSVLVMPLIQPTKCDLIESSTMKKCGDVFCACNVQLVKEITYHFKGREIMKVFTATNAMTSTYNSEAALDPYLQNLPPISSSGAVPSECPYQALAESEVCQYLLIAARRRGLKVVGAAIQMQLGSGDFDTGCFAEIVESAAIFFHSASNAGTPGLSPSEMDQHESKFKSDGRARHSSLASTVNQALFVEDACALATRTGSSSWAPKSNNGIYSQ